jgi:hypothetical protein
MRILQTKARHLNTRLRLGCAENALPFLARESNRSSLIKRQDAHDLLRAGATPKNIISGVFVFDFGRYPHQLQRSIRYQVRNYIKNSFHQLKSEFVYSSANPGADEIARNYWQFADTIDSSRSGPTILTAKRKLSFPDRLEPRMLIRPRFAS